MKKEKRLSQTIKILKIYNALSIQELAKQLDVSHMTVRRDLETLTRRNLVKLIYGGVILNPEQSGTSNESRYSLIAAGALHPEEKMKIGKKAASLIEAEDTLIIDCGSTTEYVAKYIPQDLPLTVLCYSLNTIFEIAQKANCKSIFAGGVFHENTLMFESPEGLEMIKNFRATKAFISASGVSPEFGVTCSNAYERSTKKAIIRSSLNKILLADASKFGIIRSDYFAELKDFNQIITDSGIPEDYVQIIRNLGITLHTV